MVPLLDKLCGEMINTCFFIISSPDVQICEKRSKEFIQYISARRVVRPRWN